MPIPKAVEKKRIKVNLKFHDGLGVSAYTITELRSPMVPNKDVKNPEIVIHVFGASKKTKLRKSRLKNDQRPNIRISRLSQDFRHPRNALHAFDGFPRCKKLENRPKKVKIVPKVRKCLFMWP